MSLTAFRPNSTLGDITTAATATQKAIPAGTTDVLLVASVDSWVAFGSSATVAVVGAAGTMYIPAKVPMLISLNPGWTTLSLIAGGAGLCNVSFGAQA